MIRVIFKENGQIKQLYFNSYDEYEIWCEDHENIELIHEFYIG